MEKWQAEAMKRAALVAAAVDDGCLYPMDVVKLYGDRVTVTENGEVTGIEDAVSQARAKFGGILWRRTSTQKTQTGTGGNPARQ